MKNLVLFIAGCLTLSGCDTANDSLSQNTAFGKTGANGAAASEGQACPPVLPDKDQCYVWVSAQSFAHKMFTGTRFSTPLLSGTEGTNRVLEMFSMNPKTKNYRQEVGLTWTRERTDTFDTLDLSAYQTVYSIQPWDCKTYSSWQTACTAAAAQVKLEETTTKKGCESLISEFSAKVIAKTIPADEPNAGKVYVTPSGESTACNFVVDQCQSTMAPPAPPAKATKKPIKEPAVYSG